MALTRHHWIILIFTLAYVSLAGFFFVRAGNYEFLWYIAVLLFFTAVVCVTFKVSHLPYWLLWLLSLWGLIHMLGGGYRIDDHVLYAHIIIPIFSDGGEFTILKFDQIVHAFGFGVTAVLVRYLFLRDVPKIIRPFWVGVIAVCVAMGMGTVNEIVEFIAVLASPNTGVGGYYNTSLDMVFNALGAIIGVLSAEVYSRFHKIRLVEKVS